MRCVFVLFAVLLFGCHHNDDESIIISSETPMEELPFSPSHNACNTSSFSYSLTEAINANLPGDRSAYVGTYYCPLSLEDAEGFGFSDYSGTITDNATTLVTMTSTEAFDFCSQAYEDGRVATDGILIGSASTNLSTPLAPDSLVMSPYNWPQNSIYIALSFVDFIQYAIIDLAPNGSGYDSVQFAVNSDVGVVVCFVPE